MERWSVDDLYRTVRSAAPFAELSRPIFDGVLDMLSGRYPSDEFAELRPRVTWDCVNGFVMARQGAKRVAIANAGTIPDRGLYGVFLTGADKDARASASSMKVWSSRRGRVRRFCSAPRLAHRSNHARSRDGLARARRAGQDAVLEGRGAGPTGRARHGDRKTRAELRKEEPAAAIATLQQEHGLDAKAAANLLAYLDEQFAAAGAHADDRTIVIERSGRPRRLARRGPVAARQPRPRPWAMAATARIRDEAGLDVEVMWSDDGFVVSYPDGERLPDTSLLLPDPDEVERLVVRQLGSTAMFSARFREAAGRALLLPRRRPGARAPLWQLRKRASDLLAVAARFGSFPIILETYRECLRDIFDLPALTDIMRRVRSRSLRVVNVESQKPSPFSASLLFGYVATTSTTATRRWRNARPGALRSISRSCAI
jgi:ATP-dependent Lhr-like helicase